jgi:hypothetical protein
MITDEMVEVAERTRYSACKLPYAAMRLGLEAVLPMIRADALEDAAKVADYGAQRAYRDFHDRKIAEGAQAMAAEIAEAIRAMKGDKP